MSTLTEDAANRVFDVLIEKAGAHESHREGFVYYMAEDVDLHEFRFGGDLGPGGKLYFQRSTFGPSLLVDCYSESLSDETEAIIEEVNRCLSGIDYLIKVTDERELTPEDEETIRYLMEAKREVDDE